MGKLRNYFLSGALAAAMATHVASVPFSTKPLVTYEEALNNPSVRQTYIEETAQKRCGAVRKSWKLEYDHDGSKYIAWERAKIINDFANDNEYEKILKQVIKDPNGAEKALNEMFPGEFTNSTHDERIAFSRSNIGKQRIMKYLIDDIKRGDYTHGITISDNGWVNKVFVFGSAFDEGKYYFENSYEYDPMDEKTDQGSVESVICHEVAHAQEGSPILPYWKKPSELSGYYLSEMLAWKAGLLHHKKTDGPESGNCPAYMSDLKELISIYKSYWKSKNDIPGKERASMDEFMSSFDSFIEDAQNQIKDFETRMILQGRTHKRKS